MRALARETLGAEDTMSDPTEMEAKALDAANLSSPMRGLSMDDSLIGLDAIVDYSSLVEVYEKVR